MESLAAPIFPFEKIAPRSKVRNLKLFEVLLEVFSNESAVALVCRRLAAHEAGMIEHLAGEQFLDSPPFNLRLKPSHVFFPAYLVWRTRLPIFKQLLIRRAKRFVYVVHIT